MSTFTNSHIYCNNNIYKIVLSMEDSLSELQTQNKYEKVNEK